MWWSELGAFGQTCFIIGCVTGLFMIIQIVLMIIGFSGSDDFADVGTDVDSDIFNDGFTAGLRLLSVRTVLAFLCVGSWLAYTMNSLSLPIWASLLIGIAGGAAMGFLVAVILRAFDRLQSEGNLIIENCIGQPATVYLTVPEKRSGEGKVNVYVQETLREFAAVTDDNKPLKTGSQAKVVSVAVGGVLVVEKA